MKKNKKEVKQSYVKPEIVFHGKMKEVVMVSAGVSSVAPSQL